MAGAIASYSPIIAHSRRSVHVFRYETTRGLICSIRTPRLVSAAASSFVASFAVLLFEPHTTIPPSSKATAAAKNPRSDRITPTSIAARTTAPPATAIRAARMNLRQLSILAASSSVCSSRRTISSWGSAPSSGLIHSDDSQIVRSSSSSRHESRNCCERHTSRPPSA